MKILVTQSERLSVIDGKRAVAIETMQPTSSAMPRHKLFFIGS